MLGLKQDDITLNNIKLELDDSRRLTGHNLLWQYPGAIIDAWVEGLDKMAVVDCWKKFAQQLLDGVGWSTQQTTSRIFDDGVSVAISAPIDALYAATEINEHAWRLCCDKLLVQEEHSLDATINQLKQIINDEVNPTLIDLIDASNKNQAPWLVDDDEFSLGYGASAKVWPINSLPKVSSLNWADFKRVPTAYITGTNGKSTTVRLTSTMVAAMGISCGVTSTDFIRVGQTIIDHGDYSGPGGARSLLRHRETQVALLEVARGGLLRRGLPIPQVDVAVITNIAEDHLGQYGINNLQALTQAKCLVAKALSDEGSLVLNADDTNLLAYADSLQDNESLKICWFSLDKNNSAIKNHTGDYCFIDQKVMKAKFKGELIDIASVNEVPMCLDGAAKHNIQNALAAIATALHLGISVEAIRSGLLNFNSDQSDNPGRGNIFPYNGAKVIVDFAHNVHSMDAMAATWASIPADKKYLLLSAAGDRTDQEIQAMTRSALAMMPDEIVLADLPKYLRGRESGEIPQLMATVVEKIKPDTVIRVTESPLQGAQIIINALLPGNIALLMALDQREDIAKLLENDPVQ